MRCVCWNFLEGRGVCVLVYVKRLKGNSAPLLDLAGHAIRKAREEGVMNLE